MRRLRVIAGAPHRLARGLRLRRNEATQRTRSPQEHAMMFAFVMALVGVAVLGTMNLVAAR
jgi:hypothetical protein